MLSHSPSLSYFLCRELNMLVQDLPDFGEESEIAKKYILFLLSPSSLFSPIYLFLLIKDEIFQQ
jgi:hypothetical protein